MCLIITGPSSVIRTTLLTTPLMLGSIYARNADGVGAMYANKRGLRVIKVVPKTLEEVRHMVGTLPDDDRSLALHFRMATHGTIGTDNCHPYPVVDGVAMMHNGVLECGNDGDRKRSDTSHFIEQYLASAVALSPALVHDAGFGEMVGEFIGDNNRFVFMDDEGRMTVINRDTGVEHGEMWFSNTYAWEPSDLIPGYKPRWSGSSWNSKYDLDWGKDTYPSKPLEIGYRGSPAEEAAEDKQWAEYGRDIRAREEGDMDDEDVEWAEYACEALADCDTTALASALMNSPRAALVELLAQGVPSMEVHAEDFATAEERVIVGYLVDGDITALVREAKRHPEKVADTLCYYVTWDERSDTDTARIFTGAYA